MGLCSLVAAKSLSGADARMIENQNRLIEEQSEQYKTLLTEYESVKAECDSRLNTIQTGMDKAHNLAEASRAMINAIKNGAFDFTQPQN